MMGAGDVIEPGARSDARPVADAHAAAFETFFREESDRVFRALWLVTGSRTEAEEITQDAFLLAWERWAHVAEMENATGYVYRCAMNLFRRRYRRGVLAARKMARTALRADEFSSADDREVVRATLSTLTPRQRAAIVMTELLSFTSEEAGEVLGIRPGTVRTLVSQGRKAFRVALEDDDV